MPWTKPRSFATRPWRVKKGTLAQRAARTRPRPAPRSMGGTKRLAGSSRQSMREMDKAAKRTMAAEVEPTT